MDSAKRIGTKADFTNIYRIETRENVCRWLEEILNGQATKKLSRGELDLEWCRWSESN
jgi:hypothetical protein